jgi:peptide/nickel transport system permease protein
VQTRDYLVIQGIVLVLIVAIAFVTLVMDLLYPRIDPRITYQQR